MNGRGEAVCTMSDGDGNCEREWEKSRKSTFFPTIVTMGRAEMCSALNELGGCPIWGEACGCGLVDVAKGEGRSQGIAHQFPTIKRLRSIHHRFGLSLVTLCGFVAGSGELFPRDDTDFIGPLRCGRSSDRRAPTLPCTRRPASSRHRAIRGFLRAPSPMSAKGAACR